MYGLKWLAVFVTSPFWFPVVLFCVGFCILVVGSVLVVSLLSSLLLVIWVMKIFYVTYTGLIQARKDVIKDIEKGLNKNVPWWRLLRLTINKHNKKLKDYAQYDDYKTNKEEEYIDEEEI